MSVCACPQSCPEHSRTPEQAREMLDVWEGRVHTFRGGGVVLIGADWDIEDVETCIAKHGVTVSGDVATAMHHGLVSIDDHGPVFFATREATA